MQLIETSYKNVGRILQQSRIIAVVGMSPNKERPSNKVAHYLIDAGYTVIPVNPGHEEILGLKCYPSVQEVREQIDIVNIFRNSKDVLPVVEKAIKKKAKVIWMQQGVVNVPAASMAEAAGLTVVMDRCIKIDHQHVMR